MRQRIRTIAPGLVLALLSSTPCFAQVTARWEIEGHGGLSRGSVSSGGTPTLPPPGAPIPSTTPIFPSRRTPSWFFGDGAEMLNGANANFGIAARITPLDDALGAPGLDYSNAAVIGLRARRALSPKISLEFTFDVMSGSGDVSEELLDAAEETRASFESAFRALFDSGPLTSVNVTTDLTSGGGSARELSMTGALNWHLRTEGSFQPYLTFGGGIVSGLGDLSSVNLEGSYEFFVVDQTGTLAGPYRETDRVRLRFERGTTLVGLAGLGVKRNLSERWGLRIDGRVYIGRENSRLLIDANPDVRLTVPGDPLEIGTNPSLQFSNDPATGRRSSLSGDPLDGFVAFKATGLQTRLLLTVGVFVSF